MKVFFVLCFVALTSAGPVAQDDSVVRLVASNFVNCVNSDLSLCLKENALKATERLGTVRKLKIIDGVTILNSSPKEARSLDALPTDPEARNKMVTERLWNSASDLLQQSELELSYAGEEEEESRAIGDAEESRGKKKKEVKKKLKMLIPLVLLAKAKAIALVVLSLLVIAASLYKIAVLAKIAFIVKAIAVIKALLQKKHAEEEHGWVPHMEEHPHSSGWEGGWSRSKNDAGSLAYAHYRK